MIEFHKFSEHFPTSSLWLYNKAIFNQSLDPYGKYSDLSFCTDLISFGPYVKAAVRVSAVWTSQLVNKSIVLLIYGIFVRRMQSLGFNRSPLTMLLA